MLLVWVYAVLAGNVWLATMLRRGTTLLRGTTVLAVQVSFVVAQTAWLGAAAVNVRSGVRGGPAGTYAPFEAMIVDPELRAGSIVLACFAALMLASLTFRDRWLLSGFDETGFCNVVEPSLRRLRIPFEREPGGYALSLGTGAARITYRRFGVGRALVRFERSGAGEKKLDLVRSLLAKRFEPVVPRPRIRFD